MHSEEEKLHKEAPKVKTRVVIDRDGRYFSITLHQVDNRKKLSLEFYNFGYSELKELEIDENTIILKITGNRIENLWDVLKTDIKHLEVSGFHIGNFLKKLGDTNRQNIGCKREDISSQLTLLDINGWDKSALDDTDIDGISVLGKQLETLTLCGKLFQIPDCSNFENLYFLNLNDNVISNVEALNFINGKLHLIWLSGNAISSIGTLAKLSAVKEYMGLFLDVSNNPCVRDVEKLRRTYTDFLHLKLTVNTSLAHMAALKIYSPTQGSPKFLNQCYIPKGVGTGTLLIEPHLKLKKALEEKGCILHSD